MWGPHDAAGRTAVISLCDQHLRPVVPICPVVLYGVLRSSGRPVWGGPSQHVHLTLLTVTMSKIEADYLVKGGPCGQALGAYSGFGIRDMLK
jgi:hypothetical protein